ncbi:MAG: tetratricopeptide repeat protein, partial [Actinobacteria bacterium]|nr:tetratricopeptide repeat protein [Actinomycetota bacterium]
MTTLSEISNRRPVPSTDSLLVGGVPPGGVEGVAEGLPEPLTTKLIVPHQGYVLPRPRLRTFIGGLRQGGLVSVIAGPGYGKTAFLADALSSCSGPSAYCGLDEGDKDPARFLEYLIQACAVAHPGLGDSARGRLDECLDVRREALHVVAALMADMASYSGVPTSIALDDVHCVDDSEPVVAALSFLVDGLPPGWTLLCASRRRLPFALGDMRQMGRLAEVDLRRLRLTPSEVEEWARKGWGGELSRAEARTLWRLTEGWPVALVLLGQKLQDGGRLRVKDELAGLSRQGRHLNEYLAESVFRSLDAETAGTLRAGSLLSRLVFPRDQPLFVGEVERAEEVFEELVQRGFLVTQTGHRTYTFHRLLRSYVARQAQREDPVAAASAARRAAAHLASVGELRQAVSLYLQGGAAREAVTPLRALAASHLDASSAFACEEWLDLLPADLQAVEPWLLVLRARIVQGRGECQEAEGLYRMASGLFEADDDRVGLLQAKVGQAFCLYMTGRWEDSLDALSRAESVAARDEERTEVAVNMGNVLLSQCRWDEAVERYEKALSLARGPARHAIEVRVFASRARLFFLRGRYGVALEWARRAIARSSKDARAGYASSLNAAATLLYL